MTDSMITLADQRDIKAMMQTLDTTNPMMLHLFQAIVELYDREDAIEARTAAPMIPHQIADMMDHAHRRRAPVA